MQEVVLTSEFDGYAIPLQEIQKLIRAFPRNHHYRIMLRILAETGMRPSELNRLCVSNIIRGRGVQQGLFVLYWQPGKNQRGYRKCALSPDLVAEIDAYLYSKGRKQGVLWDDGITSQNLTTYVNKHIRPVLGGRWMLKCKRKADEGAQRGIGYLYQLKGIRHTYQCLRFKHYYDKYLSAELASQFTSKEMRHSSTGMTSVYLRSLPILREVRADDLKMVMNGCDAQSRLVEFV